MAKPSARPTSDLVRWAVGTYEAGVASDHDVVRSFLLDHLANVFGGLPAESSRVALDFVRSRPGPVAAPGAVPTIEEYAAFLAGTSAHALEFDDTHQPSSSHPGSAVYPAALVVAAVEDRTFEQLAAAVVAGYEVAARVGEAATAAGQYERGFHPTGTSGVFGATVAAGLLAGLDSGALTSALGIALALSAGSMEFLADGSWTKRIHPGWAAHSAIVATRLAGGGFFGPQEPLTGRDGFLHSHSLRSEPKRLTTGLGSDPPAIRRTSVKAHACCRYMQAPIDAILRIVDEQDISPADVGEISIGVLDAGWNIIVEPLEQKLRPVSTVDAQFSMPFGAAAAVLHGRVGVAESAPEALASSAMRAMMARVRCHRSAELDALFPGRWAAEAEIVRTDGRSFGAFVDTPKGDPENPLTVDELAAKFRSLTATVLSPGDQQRLIDAVDALGDAVSPAALQELVGGLSCHLGAGRG